MFTKTGQQKTPSILPGPLCSEFLLHSNLLSRSFIWYNSSLPSSPLLCFILAFASGFISFATHRVIFTLLTWIDDFVFLFLGYTWQLCKLFMVSDTRGPCFKNVWAMNAIERSESGGEFRYSLGEETWSKEGPLWSLRRSSLKLTCEHQRWVRSCFSMLIQCWCVQLTWNS